MVHTASHSLVRVNFKSNLRAIARSLETWLGTVLARGWPDVGDCGAGVIRRSLGGCCRTDYGRLRY